LERPSDLDRVFAATAGSEAVLVQWLSLTLAHRFQIAELALRYLLPSVYEVREYVAAGGLMSYGLDYRDNWRRGATYVDRISEECPTERLASGAGQQVRVGDQPQDRQCAGAYGASDVANAR
jgi:hypothetical protein